ncbi:hypothetical protein VNO77_20634 [Canavalia gladiata]|uniref:Uncharacterized protein n=1 Tax=Canavalia gladiata TaxID=3824 RepID=A0AAN9LPX2_CANGL
MAMASVPRVFVWLFGSKFKACGFKILKEFIYYNPILVRESDLHAFLIQDSLSLEFTITVAIDLVFIRDFRVLLLTRFKCMLETRFINGVLNLSVKDTRLQYLLVRRWKSYPCIQF